MSVNESSQQEGIVDNYPENESGVDMEDQIVPGGGQNIDMMQGIDTLDDAD
jgi:hypothetical protein